MRKKTREGEDASGGDEARADAINAAAPKLDLEAIGAVIMQARELAAKKLFTYGVFVVACNEIAKLTSNDPDSQAEYIEALRELMTGAK